MPASRTSIAPNVKMLFAVVFVLLAIPMLFVLAKRKPTPTTLAVASQEENSLAQLSSSPQSHQDA